MENKLTKSETADAMSVDMFLWDLRSGLVGVGSFIHSSISLNEDNKPSGSSSDSMSYLYSGVTARLKINYVFKEYLNSLKSWQAILQTKGVAQ